MKAKKVAKEIKNENIVTQYKVLAKKCKEQAEDQINRRTHGEIPTKSTVRGVVEGLEDWVKAATRELGWPKQLTDIFLLLQGTEILDEFGFYRSGFQKQKEKAERILKKVGIK